MTSVTVLNVYLSDESFVLRTVRRSGRARVSRDRADRVVRPRAVRLVQGDRRDVVVRHHLKNDILVSIAERGAEGVGGVGGGGPVQYDGALADPQRARHHLPFAIGGHRHPAPALHQRVRLRFIMLDGELEFAAMVHIEVVMPGVIRVQDELLHLVGASVEQHVQAQREVVEEVVGGGGRASPRGGAVDAHLVVRLVVEPRRGAQRARHALAAVPEPHHADQRHLRRLQRPARAFGEHVQPQPHSAGGVAEDVTPPQV